MVLGTRVLKYRVLGPFGNLKVLKAIAHKPETVLKMSTALHVVCSHVGHGQNSAKGNYVAVEHWIFILKSD